MGKNKKKKKQKERPAEAGLPGDPAILKAMTEIGIIAHLAENEFQRLLPDGMTPAQYGVLNHLLRLKTTKTVSELASAFQVAQPTMSSTVRKLEDKNYIEFIPDTDDRRIKRVAVTKAGKSMRKAAIRALGPHWAMLEKAMPGTDWSGILPLLTRLRVFLDERRQIGAGPNAPQFFSR